MSPGSSWPGSLLGGLFSPELVSPGLDLLISVVLHKLHLISLPFAKGEKEIKIFKETLADLGTEGGGDGEGGCWFGEGLFILL